MTNPQWLELPMSRTNFHGLKDVRAIEVQLLCVRLNTPPVAGLSELDFPTKENKNKDCTIMMYGETFYGRHTILNISCSEVKHNNQFDVNTAYEKRFLKKRSILTKKKKKKKKKTTIENSSGMSYILSNFKEEFIQSKMGYIIFLFQIVIVHIILGNQEPLADEAMTSLISHKYLWDRSEQILEVSTCFWNISFYERRSLRV